MIAILDLDDSLLDLETPLFEAFPAISNIKGEHRYHSRSNILDIIIKHKLLEKLKPFNQTINFINRLKENNIEIVLVTARGWYPNAYNITKNNLSSHNIYFDELIICDLNENKGKFLNKNDRYILSLEDNPYNHMNFKESGVENPYCKIAPAFDYSKIAQEELIRCHSEINI